MRMLATGAALALLLLPARADWRNLDGQKAPEIKVKEWLNTGRDEPDADTLRGKVWIIEFFATW